MQLIEAACDSSVSNSAHRWCVAQLANKVDRELNLLWDGDMASIDATRQLTPSQRA